MKTSRIIGLALFAVLFCLSACSKGGDDPIEPTPKPEETKSEILIDSSIITNGLSFSTDKGEQSISFTTNENWTLSIASTTSGSSWCTASATSGVKGTTTVKFTVVENAEYDDRSVSVTIKAGAASKTFIVTQKGADALLVTANKYEVAQKGGKIEVEVKANIDYELFVSETAKDWITESKSESRALTTYKHTFEIAASEEAEKRIGEIMFQSGNKVEIVTVYQAGGAILLLSQNEFSVCDTGETISVEVKSNVEYGVQMPDVDWITDEASTRGMSSHTLKYVVSPNESYDNRSADIVFYDLNSDLKDTLKVVQAQKGAIVISQNRYEVKAEGETIEVKLSANVDFEISMPEVDWIKQVESRGLTDHMLYFNILANKGKDNRVAYIKFTDKDNILKETLVIKQLSEYGYFEFQDYNQTFGYVELNQAGTLEKTLPSEGNLRNMIELKVVGPINGDDIYYLRTMFRKDTWEQNLQTLDLSEASIVEGGSADKYYTSNNIIGDRMFSGFTNLGSITLPNNAMSIGKYAFSSCPKLVYVFMGNDLSSIGECAFNGCNKLSYVNIGRGVVSIGESCFRNCGISAITIPDNVTSIRDGAFAGCKNLKTVRIGNGLTSINEYAFSDCNALETIIIGDNVTQIGFDAFANCSSLTFIDAHNVTLIWDGAFRNCSSLASIDIGNCIETIGEGVFSGCSSLASIDIPGSVKKIKKYAFKECASLASVTIPGSVTEIGSSAFQGCSSLSSITIGDGVTTIEEDAFNGCISLDSVYITNLSAWCKIDFKGINPNYADCDKAYSNPLSNCGRLYLNNQELTELVIPKGITELKSSTFWHCSSLTSVTIGDDVTIIGNSAFAGCSSLTSVTIGDDVTIIGNSAFKDCSSLSKVSFGKNLNEIEDMAFKGASIMECYSYNATPPYIWKYSSQQSEKNTFYEAIEEGAVLYVPKGSFDKYRKSKWYDYFYVREMD